MAGFNALKFIFDNKPSEGYGLYILDFDGGGVKTNSAGSDVEIIQDQISRRAVSYFYGVSQSSKLEFEITIGSYEKMDRRDIAVLESWLFGQMDYKKLQIIQCDLDNVYFNCFLKNPQVTTIGNIPYAFTCTVVCDSPWAWEFPRTKVSATSEVETNIEFYNYSDDSDYLYPIVEFTLDINTTDIKVINISDDNREFIMTGLLPNETIYADNSLEILTSSTGLNRLPNFNGKWYRYVRGLNKIKIVGGLSSYKVTYQLARKVGS